MYMIHLCVIHSLLKIISVFDNIVNELHSVAEFIFDMFFAKVYMEVLNFYFITVYYW